MLSMLIVSESTERNRFLGESPGPVVWMAAMLATLRG